MTFIERNGELRRARIAGENPEIAADLAEVVIDPPDRTFSETAVVEVGGRPVELRYLGRGHTDHDIVISVPGAGVLFGGDLIENGAVPWFGDGYPLDWPETALRLAELATGVVVPGHGDHAGPGFADQQATALLALAELGRRVHRGELTLDEAVAQTPFPALPARGRPSPAPADAHAAPGRPRLGDRLLRQSCRRPVLHLLDPPTSTPSLLMPDRARERASRAPRDVDPCVRVDQNGAGRRATGSETQSLAMASIDDR